MIRKKQVKQGNRLRHISIKKNQFVMFMCIGLIAIVLLSTMNIQLASAGTKGQMLLKTPEYPMEPGNYTEILYCSGCHYDNPSVSISVTIDDETQSDITYYINGSTETFEGAEGWGVFDNLQNKKGGGPYSDYFTLPKDGNTYRFFWVDNGTTDPPDPDHPGGSAYIDITTPTNAPSTPVITGPESGYTETSYSYDFVSTDDDGNDIFYFIKWGDGQEEDWFGPNPSGVPVTKSHSWSEPGNYTIEAKARDSTQQESDWGTLAVQIISEPGLKIRLKVVSIGRVCANIENVGAGSLSDINWNISVEGGLFRLIKRINANGNGTIETLGAGEKQVVCTPEKSIILRFGIAKVTVTATIGEKTFTHNQFVLVTGQLIFARLLLFRK